ncbi:MAG TPA: hypothetical protein VFX02_12640 [Gammaproteobacteria bacterium]|nr:hypothetical protein [Gammaproteobacteria bacterium]
MPSKVIQHNNLRHFFQESVKQALKNQHLQAQEYTIVYLVNLLTSFSRSENLFEIEPTSGGLALKPLAGFYKDAINAGSDFERDLALQRMGDIALFISGIFSQSLQRKAVDIDYYVNMGGHAYSYLAEVKQRKLNGAALGEIFTELADKFVGFVDVLGEVGEGMQAPSDTGLLRLYEVWVRTGSRRAQNQLLKQGLQVSMDQGFLNKRH